MSEREVLLDVQELSVDFRVDRKTTLRAVREVSFQVYKGETLGILGESGCGKSVTCMSILRLEPEKTTRYPSGRILFGNQDLLTLATKELGKIRGNEIGMIFQDCGGTLNPIRKIGSQFVEYICTHSKVSKDEAWKKGVSMLEKMRLPEAENIMNSYPHQLSGGMRQRVGIAMAMTFNPELLLADEPTSALDVTTQAQIVRQMMELRDDFHTGIIIVTHNIGVAAYMADQLIVMQNGKVVDQGTRDEVMNHPTSDYTKKLLAAVPEMEGRRFV